ncbi:uncharacterized protein EI97DRAFT_201985 [Westerdykella ornata]|uniref:tRNA-splicing endonuclease subunit Sen2 n=1 Tax=Westerdykella ornata TaxID=318751 RepID=A0A6A6JBT5_WESOR|nr:uncharacterized protein EI97DRAFT_201985 [Westerdykella ornata]KAF2272649.1 hypothetical protein EI97DRAFT_201985 [Westerdykella ornata]
MASTAHQPSNSPVQSSDVADAGAKGVPKDNGKPNVPREKRPNYAQIHSRPLPIDVYPLPAFIPHNPLSIVRVAIALISQTLWPPISPLVIHEAYFSSQTLSIHVTDPQSVRALWEQGFWGKGSLSRSEPRWLDMEKRKRGLKAMQTSEEYTAQRRRERRQFKLERARLEREAIEEQRRAEARLAEASSLDATGNDAEPTTSDGVVQTEALISKVDAASMSEPEFVPADDDVTKETEEDLVAESSVEDGPFEIQNQEHLQLTMEEAFFLSYALGALKVERQGIHQSSSQLLRLFCASSTFSTLQSPQTLEEVLPRTPIFGNPIAPDNPFLLKYVVFHHFRSLGWVVRANIKFAVDFLLYNRGPAFSHAEFAVMVLPSYSHPYWSETTERREECKKKESRDWWWLHRVNRVQGLAHKSLMLVYVEVPPPWDKGGQSQDGKLDVGDILKRYKVREFVLGRWTPNRHRG